MIRLGVLAGTFVTLSIVKLSNSIHHNYVQIVLLAENCFWFQQTILVARGIDALFVLFGGLEKGRLVR